VATRSSRCTGQGGYSTRPTERWPLAAHSEWGSRLSSSQEVVIRHRAGRAPVPPVKQAQPNRMANRWGNASSSRRALSHSDIPRAGRTGTRFGCTPWRGLRLGPQDEPQLSVDSYGCRLGLSTVSTWTAGARNAHMFGIGVDNSLVILWAKASPLRSQGGTLVVTTRTLGRRRLTDLGGLRLHGIYRTAVRLDGQAGESPQCPTSEGKPRSVSRPGCPPC